MTLAVKAEYKLLYAYLKVGGGLCATVMHRLFPKLQMSTSECPRHKSPSPDDCVGASCPCKGASMSQLLCHAGQDPMLEVQKMTWLANEYRIVLGAA